MKEDNELHFSSDTFRLYNLHRFYENPDKEIGMYFAKLKVYGFVESVGEVPSEIGTNHKRKVDLLRWTEKGRNIRSVVLA